MNNKYTTVQGDLWDTISLKFYGNEHYIHVLIESNYQYRDIAIFPAVVDLIIPEIEVKNKPSFPKWRKTMIC